LLGRAGSRRTTSPSLRYDVLRIEAGLPRTRLGSDVNIASMPLQMGKTN